MPATPAYVQEPKVLLLAEQDIHRLQGLRLHVHSDIAAFNHHVLKSHWGFLIECLQKMSLNKNLGFDQIVEELKKLGLVQEGHMKQGFDDLKNALIKDSENLEVSARVPEVISMVWSLSKILTETDVVSTTGLQLFTKMLLEDLSKTQEKGFVGYFFKTALAFLGIYIDTLTKSQ